ncbi:MAG: crosslink repair DNA glycosylase YcaQ family protein [Paracoccaceae bacterium]
MTQHVPVLNNADARRLFLDRHGLGEAPQGPAKGTALGAVIERLGFVQLDSINTVARAHDLILFSRRPAYRPPDLKRLYERDRALFEHWTHDAAVIPIAFYPHWHLRRLRDAEKLKKQWRSWRRGEFEDQLRTVLDHVRDHGSVCSSDVGKDEKRGSGGWWDWHPSKTALEYLWRSGALTVTGRDGFQKRYDLTERVIEEGLACACPDLVQTIDWKCAGALDRLGFATSGEIAAFWDTVTPAETKNWCARQVAKGSLIEIDVKGADGSMRRSFARPDVLQQAASAPEPSSRLRVLSPFDPALRDRARAERLFGFHFRVEMFVPEPKRKYGYYVFPLLKGHRLVGRIDMKAFRDRDQLIVRGVWPEKGARWSATRTSQLESELVRIARLAGVTKVEFERGWLRE